MLRPTLVPLLALSFALFLGACRTAPSPDANRVIFTPAAPVSSAAPVLPPEAPPPAGVTISPPLAGDGVETFLESRAGERTFPHNVIGANLAFTANLKMPKLEAVSLDRDRFQLRMRFSNAGDTPLFVSLVCTYDGEAREARSVHRVQFPVNTYRDIAFDLDGAPSRKVNIQATAEPVLTL